MSASRTVNDYLEGMNDTVFLPGIQREFVWKPSQIEGLFDSMIRDYPIGAIVVWNVQHADNSEFTTYRFVEQLLDEDGKIPTIVERDFDHRRNNQRVSAEEDCGELIIDGQQRLTALNIGFNGDVLQYTGGRGNKKSEKDNWTEKVLCVNVLGHPSYGGQLEADYEFKFLPKDNLEEFSPDPRNPGGEDEVKTNTIRVQLEESDTNRAWVSIPSLRMSNEERDGSSSAVPNDETSLTVELLMNQMQLENEARTRYQRVSRTVIGELNDMVDSEITTERFKKPSGHIPEIFQRLNMRGSRPKPYQLLMSQLMSRWPHDSENPFNPREKTEAYIEAFQSEFSDWDSVVDREFILRCLCYISGVELRKAAIDDLSEEQISEMKERWIGDDSEEIGERFRSSIENALEALSSAGFDQESLDKGPLMALVAKYFYETQNDVSSDVEDIQKFIGLCLLLNESYDIARRSKASEMCEVINSTHDSFPREEIFEYMGFHPTREDIEEVVEGAEYEYSKSRDGVSRYTTGDAAAVLSLLEAIKLDRKGDNLSKKKFDIDHIFPRSKATEIDSEYSIDNVANLQVLDSNLNRDGKKSLWPYQWVTSGGPSVAELQRKCFYPSMDYEDETEMLKRDNFEEFIEARQDVIIDRLTEEYLKD